MLYTCTFLSKNKKDHLTPSTSWLTVVKTVCRIDTLPNFLRLHLSNGIHKNLIKVFKCSNFAKMHFGSERFCTSPLDADINGKIGRSSTQPGLPNRRGFTQLFKQHGPSNCERFLANEKHRPEMKLSLATVNNDARHTFFFLFVCFCLIFFLWMSG